MPSSLVKVVFAALRKLRNDVSMPNAIRSLQIREEHIKVDLLARSMLGLMRAI